MIFKSFGLVAVSALALSVPAWAHHSHANYEPTITKTVTGTVTEYLWINPHTWVYLTVMGEDGQPQEWALESGSTGQLTRRGWAGDSMKPGDTITATVKPLKDGAYGGVLGMIELADGTQLCDPFGGINPEGTVCTE